VPEEPPPSSSAIQLPSIRTEIDPLTAAAAAPPTPSSSPPAIDKLVVEAEAEVDPNHGRRKRRKQTPPQTSIRIRVDNKTGLILSSSPVRDPRGSSKFEVKYDRESPRGRLTIRAMDSITSEQLMLRSSAHPSSPVLPQLEDAPYSPKFSIQEPKQYRTWSNYDKKTHILTITSSPPPGAVPKNAFTMLGKKEKPAPVVKKDHEEKMSPKRTRKKVDMPQPPAEHSNAVVTKLNSTPQWTCDSNKPLHPFFNPAERKKMAQPPPAKVDSAPGSGDEINKADGSTETLQLPSRPLSRDKSTWAFTSSFGSSRGAKMHGTLEAPWPSRDSVHVRGLEDMTRAIDICELPSERKQKGTAVIVEPDQDVLISLASKLSITDLRGEIASDDYAAIKYHRVSTEVRLPARKVVAGSQLQDMIRPRISARLPHPKALEKMEVESGSDNDTIVVAGTKVHPALLHLYQRLGTELTAFDKHEYDSIPWEVKYAPQTAGQVLQTHREIGVISQWLMGQKTDKLGVKESAGKRKARGTAGGKAITKKKRKKKDDELDAFVVTSEEEQSLMSEITDPEEDDWLNPVTKTKKSTIRACNRLDELDSHGRDSGKITNTIVVSGPTGCGKTAAVYAIAKELGYTVFEVNAGTRRNGKDVLDSVGDMSRNHHVHQAKGVYGEDNPFARTKTAKERVSAIEDEVQMRQQQSLILFEEVDILFEEDKGFWSTILNLMGKSKRPIVLTCNDESQLPWDDLSLHAVLRFSQPAHDLLVDHLLLICANEGHLLQRPSVDALVTSTKGDIRASIMELQFYCRMAVGDRRGGLDWLLARYPAGCDLTSDGEKLRVVSEDTYHKGMGWIDTTPAAKEENRWQQVWDEYGLDIGATDVGIGECTNDVQESGVGEGIILRVTDEFFGSRSDTDAFASLTSSRLDDVGF
jgi:DNA polymerase III delta prime subunit